MSAVMIQNSFAEPERKAIRIACVEYPPFTLKDGTGASADMLNELFDKMGYNISIEVYPLGRVISMVNKGEIEAARLFPQTDPKVTVAIPIQYSSAVFVYKKSMFPSGINFKTLSDLQQYRIGALSNSKWTVKLLEEGAGLQLDFAPGNDLNLKKIYLERIHLLPLIRRNKPPACRWYEQWLCQ